jgi:hypothetical protein
MGQAGKSKTRQTGLFHSLDLLNFFTYSFIVLIGFAPKSPKRQFFLYLIISGTNTVKARAPTAYKC